MQIFKNCSDLSSLPDISKWNTNNITNIESMFELCSSLIELPDVSIWNTNNVNNMSFMFNKCRNYHHYLIFLNGIQIK